MKRPVNILILLSFVCFIPTTWGQKLEYLRTLTLTGDYFDTDAMNHIYLVQGDKLIKFNFDGQQQFVYSNKGFGKIFSVDATNPLKILVFFQESGACVFLDNTLTENSEPFYLYDYCCDLPLLSAASQLNGIWVYENINFELMRYDTNWKELATTGNLYQLLKKEITPKKIIERNGKVYLLTENSIEIFDVFGTYLKTLPVNNVSDFDIEGESMVYIQKDKVVLLNLKTLDETVLNNTGQYQSLSLSEKKLFLSQRKGIDIFQIKYE